jgi:hypothetical protein
LVGCGVTGAVVGDPVDEPGVVVGVVGAEPLPVGGPFVVVDPNVSEAGAV